MIRRFANISVLLLFAIIFTPFAGYSQRVAVTSDIIKWGTLSPNIGVDLVLSERLSIDIEASYNPSHKYILSDEISFHHISFSPELRYWLRRPFYAHYFGVNMLCSSYDLRYDGAMRDGMVVAFGVGYGYSIMLSDRWNLVPSIGVGLGFVSYATQKATSEVNPKISQVKLIPTRLGVSFTYIID